MLINKPDETVRKSRRDRINLCKKRAGTMDDHAEVDSVGGVRNEALSNGVVCTSVSEAAHVYIRPFTASLLLYIFVCVCMWGADLTPRHAIDVWVVPNEWPSPPPHLLENAYAHIQVHIHHRVYTSITCVCMCIRHT